MLNGFLKNIPKNPLKFAYLALEKYYKIVFENIFKNSLILASGELEQKKISKKIIRWSLKNIHENLRLSESWSLKNILRKSRSLSNSP